MDLHLTELRIHELPLENPENLRELSNNHRNFQNGLQDSLSFYILLWEKGPQGSSMRT